MNNSNNNSNNSNNNSNNNNSNKNEIIITDETIEIANNTFETSVLNWLRFVFVIFTTGIALITFTKVSRLYALLIFGIGLFLLMLRIVDYWMERGRLLLRGINIRFRIDALMISMIPIFIFVCWLLYKLW